MIDGITAVATIAASTTGTVPASLEEAPPAEVSYYQAPRSVGTDIGLFIKLADSHAFAADHLVFSSPGQVGWLATWRRDLAAFRSLPVGWDGAGAEPPNGSALTLALDVLEEFWELGLQPTRIAPSVEEGILIELQTDRGSGNLECFNTGELLAALHAGGKPEVWEISEQGRTLEESVAEIRAALQG